jgi:hypothetical protein
VSAKVFGNDLLQKELLIVKYSKEESLISGWASGLLDVLIYTRWIANSTETVYIGIWYSLRNYSQDNFVEENFSRHCWWLRNLEQELLINR